MSTCLSPVRRPVANPTTGKIQSSHLQRLAVVYVRQSTLQQVAHHQESTRLQYALVDRAIALGWAPSQVLVIDEDQGHSGATAAGRPGFQRLVAEVGLDHIGLVLSIEISRLARNSRDWYQLLEVCGLFATLIGDADGLYDPQTYNDRLLLGLKGTMSEAELHILKQRLLEGKRAKARRGELQDPPADGLRPRALRGGGQGPRRAGACGHRHGVRPIRAVAARSMGSCATWSTTSCSCPTGSSAVPRPGNCSGVVPTA